MMTRIKAKPAIDARDKIGESPVWDAAGSRFLWSDNQLGIIHEAKSIDSERWKETKRWNLGQVLAAAIPRAQGGLVVATALDIVMLDDSGAVAPFAHVEFNSQTERMNDAKCDPKGRLWASTLTSDFRPGGAALYRIDPDGGVTKMLGGITLGNGFDWSPDGSTFYFIDSVTRSIDAFDFDLHAGTISNQRTVVTVEWGRGVPNGMAVDRDGHLWVAATGAGEVQCYSPDGALLSSIEISIPGATSCAFGGADGKDLCITSLSRRVSEIALTLGVSADKMDNTGPEAGSLFICRPGPSGAPATPFAG